MILSSEQREFIDDINASLRKLAPQVYKPEFQARIQGALQLPHGPLRDAEIVRLTKLPHVPRISEGQFLSALPERTRSQIVDGKKAVEDFIKQGFLVISPDGRITKGNRNILDARFYEQERIIRFMKSELVTLGIILLLVGVVLIGLGVIFLVIAKATSISPLVGLAPGAATLAFLCLFLGAGAVVVGVIFLFYAAKYGSDDEPVATFEYDPFHPKFTAIDGSWRLTADFEISGTTGFAY